MINKTNDLSIFKSHAGNRGLIQFNIEKLKNSILTKNLLQFRPIMVNENMEVLDGQHRLAAAKELEIPIYYQVVEGSRSEDIPLLNIQEAWKKEDALNFYISLGNLDYIQLKTFMRENNLLFSNALRFVLHASSHSGDSFRKGKFKFPDKDYMADIKNTMLKINTVIDFLIPRVPGPNAYLRATRFIFALKKFLEIRSVDFDLFMHKLSMRLDLIRPCHSAATTIKVFKQIYNWKNKNGITIEEDHFLENNP